MIIEPKARGFICTTAHPTGCKENVGRQIAYVKEKGTMEGPKKVLVIGASTGYGLASRITAAFGCGAATIGVMFEKEAFGKRTATPGYYNTKAFEEFAKEEGLYAKSINGDAFSKEIKDQTIAIKAIFANIWLSSATADMDLIPELESVKGDDEAILDRFYKNLEFGTAGLRGVIGAGTNRMNVYTVNQATQGLAD